ncbi:MAG: hypothetical protein Q8M22_13985 [Actinomycetota bacterium]|nr:hypothetical protein [Actinomycetota bacterium]
MRVARPLALIVGLSCVTAACTDLSPSKERASDVYATIIRSFADDSEADPPLKVFVEPRGEGSSINVDVQAEVITAVEDVAEVRFIDARDEALEDTGDGVLVVRDGGILLAFGPVPNDAADVTVEVDQYLDGTSVRTHRFVMRRSGDVWLIDGSSSVDETVTPDEP